MYNYTKRIRWLEFKKRIIQSQLVIKIKARSSQCFINREPYRTLFIVATNNKLSSYKEETEGGGRRRHTALSGFPFPTGDNWGTCWLKRQAKAMFQHIFGCTKAFFSEKRKFWLCFAINTRLTMPHSFLPNSQTHTHLHGRKEW